jgi:methylthioribose-1-phosphate isomerase
MRAVDWVDGKVCFIDQTRLPGQECVVETSDHRTVAEAIRVLRIRGAPAIGVAAAFAMVLPLQAFPPASTDWEGEWQEAHDLLTRSRPTAVNLFNALSAMKRLVETLRGSGAGHARGVLLEEARKLQQQDIEACAQIGSRGAALLPDGALVLTHCNTGALATAGEGTALAVIKTAARQGKVRGVFVDETRPLFQGARLTMWELQREGIPATLITDGTAGSVLRDGKISAVLVGADRIAQNGDAANKIGTYPLAVLALYHHVPFYVAAPVSTFDSSALSGSDIPIELRNPDDIVKIGNTAIAPEGATVFAPAFDVTPAHLITAIITEHAVLSPPFDRSIARMLTQSAEAG